MRKVQLKILDKEFYNEFTLPEYATFGSAGLDLRADVKPNLRLYPNDVKLIPTGISIYIEDPSMAAIILPRSGLGHKNGLILGNGTGLIDSDYQGELFVSMWNRSTNPFDVQYGDRISQLVFIPVIRTNFTVVNEFEDSLRGTYGFGHSGIK